MHHIVSIGVSEVLFIYLYVWVFFQENLISNTDIRSRYWSKLVYSLIQIFNFFSPSGLSYLSITLEMVGKFGITTGTALMFVYTAELFPTVLRNTATGMCTTVSRVGSCIAPFLLKLSEWRNVSQIFINKHFIKYI